MAQLAIKGHPTRGKEVIEILEMLGGSNFHNYGADCNSLCFYLGKSTNIIYYDWVNNCYEDEDILVYTLEEFEEKFPYKVGDKVTLDGFSCTITGMNWEYDDVIYYVKGGDFSKGVYSKDLQPYKEETMETLNNETNKAIFETNAQACDIMNDIIKKDMKEIKIDIPNGYEFFGIDDDNNKIVLTKKQPQYPKTYEECCEVIDYRLLGTTIIGYKAVVLKTFQKLLICRDAYWKIAGEQMGLGKPWEPDWNNGHVEKYYIYLKQNEINKSSCFFDRHFFTFPTKEMRDAFYENFKELIEQCKELL